MKFIIEGAPIAKIRHRCGCRGNKPFSYDPQLKEQAEFVRAEIRRQWNQSFESKVKSHVLEASDLTQDKSFSIKLTFLFPITESSTLSQRSAKFWNLEHHSIKPDVDNLAKFYLDCCNDIIWKDDAQVAIASVRKLFSNNPRTEIDIMANEEISIHKNVKEVLKVFSPDLLQRFCHEAFVFSYEKDFMQKIAEAEDKDYQKQQYIHLASILVSFAENWTEKLKKIQKLSIPEEI